MNFLYGSIKKLSSKLRRKSSKRKTIKSRSLTPKPKNEFNVIYEDEESSSPNPDNIFPKKNEEIELQFPDPLPNKITFDIKIGKKMNDLYKKHKSLKPFVGNAYFQTLFFLYLFKKYKTNCLITRNLNELNVPELVIIIDSTFSDINNKSREDFIKQFTKCVSNNEPIIIIPINIQIQISEPATGHANMLIYRNNTRELEHFEPHGYKFGGFTTHSYTNKISDFIKNYLKELVELTNIELHKKELPNIKLLEAHDVCPRLIGLQSLENETRLPLLPIEPEGYCSAWSMFFAEMCLKNPEIPSAQIYNAMLDKTKFQNKNYLRKVIRGYTCFINNKLAKHFSQIFENDITSAKVVEYAKQEKKNWRERTLDGANFLYDIQIIMENETNPDFKPLNAPRRNNTVSKYEKFKQSIKQDTSSSESDIRSKSDSDSNSYGHSWSDNSKSSSNSNTKKNKSADKFNKPKTP
jgi:hypothetical protein